jgi:hypothetical protein
LSQEGVITRLRPKALGRGYRSRYLVGVAISDTSGGVKSPYLITSFPTTAVNTDESDKSDQGVPFVSDHFFSSEAASLTAESDPIPVKKAVENFSKKSENLQSVDHLSLKSLPDIEKKVITGSDQISDQRFEISDHGSDPSPPLDENRNIPLQTTPSSPPPIKMRINSPSGYIKAIATPDGDKQWNLEWTFPNDATKTESINGDPRSASKKLQAVAKRWIDKLRFSVRQMGEEDYEWITGCKSIESPFPPIRCWYVFQTANGLQIRVRGEEEFRLESGGNG